MTIAKLNEVHSKALRRSAKHEPCLIRAPIPEKSRACHDPETTVLTHYNGGGMGDKHSDEKSAYGCYWCHTVYDATPSSYDIADEAMTAMGTTDERRALTKLYLEYLFLRAHLRTLDYFRAKNLVEWK